ncbi:MAG TPA: ABC transporter ATP-binding protein [Acidimicrobiia bacterium]|nr:ABC transporter ATP-binding protein [Acidimicrobiia bacterium]
MADHVEIPLLHADEVSIRFGGLQALDRVTFQVNDGEIVGLIGPNGAGKTTFFNCVTGFYTPNTGRVYYSGKDITDYRPDQRVHLGIGRTFQQVGLVRSFTVLENVMVAQHQKIEYDTGAGLIGAPDSWYEERLVRERAFEVLDYLGLLHLAHSRLDNLSYGTLKQVEVAAVLGTDPDVLMLDEPLAGLAPEEGEEFGDRILEMREELGLTVIVIEHHVPFMLRICDYIYVLNFGQLLAEGEPAEIRKNVAVAEAYMGEGATALG